MPILFPCGYCQRRVSVSRKQAGQRVPCPRCHVEIQVPSLEAARAGGEVAVAASGEDQPLHHTLVATEPSRDDELDRERTKLELERARLELERAALQRAREAARQEAVDETDDEDQDEDETIECPDCAEPIRARAKVCRYCGCSIGRDRRGRPIKRPRGDERGGREGRVGRGGRGSRLRPRANPGLAAVLSAIWPGAGCIYAGHILMGILIMVGGPMLVLVLLMAGAMAGLGAGGLLVPWFAALAIWIFQIYYSYTVADSQ